MIEQERKEIDANLREVMAEDSEFEKRLVGGTLLGYPYHLVCRTVFVVVREL